LTGNVVSIAAGRAAALHEIADEIGRRIRRKSLTQASRHQEGLIAAVLPHCGRRGHLRRLARIEVRLKLRLRFASRLCSAASPAGCRLHQTPRRGRFAQLDIEIHRLARAAHGRLLGGRETEHLDFQRPGAFSERYESVGPVHTRHGGDRLVLERRSDRGAGNGLRTRPHHAGLRDQRNASETNQGE
jgi:hypothetical protein